MKHFSGIDYEHFLDDIRDMYPFSVDEAVLVELVANSLDAKTSLIDFRVDPDQRIFELTDNGVGMDKKGFEMYHNFSTSFKRKGQGIGFAGLGAKLALKISDRIITETRSKNYWGTSDWRFERKRRMLHPVWYDLPDRTLPHCGTRVRFHLKHKSSCLLQLEEMRRILLTHYLPLLTLHEFYESVKLYKRVTFLLNGDLLQPPALPTGGPEKFKQYLLHRGRSRKPFALARFELHRAALPEDAQGIAISTFGKIIKREWLRQFVRGMDRITGIIEVPELVDALTTSKCDFRKEGTAGNKYYRFSKAAQREFRSWLEELELVEKKESGSDKEVVRLRRVVNRIVGEIPDLQQFYGLRSEREGLVRDPEGDLLGVRPQSPVNPEKESRVESSEHPIPDEIGQAGIRGQGLEEGDELAAVRRLRSIRFGPTIHYASAPDRDDLSWMEGDAVMINTAHPTYQKAASKKVVEYHDLIAVALAMLREVPTASEKLELLERFMSRWGKLV